MIDKDGLQAADDRNHVAFTTILAELMKTHAGSFALMRDGQIVQFFDTMLDAMANGRERFEDGLFSVLEVTDQPIVRNIRENTVSETIESNPSEAGESLAPVAVSEGPMRVIVFASQKGGAGKTTLCGQLAVQAELVGAGPVALIDADPQGSLAEWWNARESETPLFVKTHFANLPNDLNQLRQNRIRLVFIDTPPAVTDTIREVVGHADLVVIPTRPSPHDLRAVGATVDIIENQHKTLIFAVNAATARARITGEAAVALSQHGTVAPVTVHQRVDFATSMINGSTVMEMKPDSRSAKEMLELWQYIATRLGKVERRSVERSFEGPDQRYPNQGVGFGRRRVAPGFGRRVAD